MNCVKKWYEGEKRKMGAGRTDLCRRQVRRNEMMEVDEAEEVKSAKERDGCKIAKNH